MRRWIIPAAPYFRHFRVDQKEELGMSLYVCPRAGAWETSESHHKL